jgi:phenylacetate-coenzyme A ligase PaaK-like adenylate-forming protein
MNTLSRHILTPLYNSSRGFGAINSHTKRWQEFFRLPYEDAKETERRMLSSILRSAYETSDYYRKLFDEASVGVDFDSPDTLEKIPMLTKSVIRSSALDLTNRNLPKSALIETHSGGTTGDPMYFYRDKNSYCHRWGLQAAANMQLGWNLGEWYALVWGASQDLPSAYTARYRLMNYFVHKKIILDAGMLNEESIEWFVGQLHKRRPRVIYGYAMMIELLAEALQQTGASFPKPQTVIVTAETLTPKANKTIGACFEATVINRYATREFGVLADQCAGSEYMRVVPNSLKLEILPLSAEDPAFGEIIVTDLINFAMPFIRYRSGDVGRLSEREVNGRTGLYLSELSGRVSDFLVTPSGRVVSNVALLPGFFVPHPHILQAQIIQSAKNDFRILVVSEKPEPATKDADDIARTFEKFCGEPINVTVGFVDQILPEASGKTRFIKSEVSPRLFDNSAR